MPAEPTDPPAPQSQAWLDNLRDPMPALAVLAGLRLDLFSRIRQTAQGSRELAASMQCDPRRLDGLLRALVAVDLVKIEQGDEPRFVCKLGGGPLAEFGQPGI